MRIVFSFLSIVLLCSLNTMAQTPAGTPSARKPPAQQKATASSSDEKKIDPAKEKDIRQLLELTGLADRMSEVMTEMEKNIKPMMESALPPGDYRAKLIDAFFEKFHSKLNLSELVDLTVPIYDKHFSHEEIKGLITFYKTPLGKKAISELPQLMSESMNAGQKWGENLGRTSMLEVLAEHPEFAKALEEAQKSAPAPHQ